MLNTVLGALNVITYHHVTSHKPTRSRWEQKHPPETGTDISSKTEIQDPSTPRERAEGSVPSCSHLLWASVTLAATTVFSLHIISKTFQDFLFIRLFLILFTTSYSVTLLPVRDWRKMARVKLKSTHLSNNQWWNNHFQRLNSRESTERKVWNLFNSKWSC